MTRAATLIATRPQVFAHLTDKLVVCITYPAPEWMAALNPHAKGDWRGKTAPTKWLRSEVASVCRQPNVPRFERARVTYRFFFPRKGGTDEANMIQRMKPAIDGIVDAGVIPDDNWGVLSTAGVESCKDAANPRIEIVIQRSIA